MVFHVCTNQPHAEVSAGCSTAGGQSSTPGRFGALWQGIPLWIISYSPVEPLDITPLGITSDGIVETSNGFPPLQATPRLAAEPTLNLCEMTEQKEHVIHRLFITLSPYHTKAYDVLHNFHKAHYGECCILDNPILHFR